MKKELLIHEGFMTFHSGKRPLQSSIVCGVFIRLHACGWAGDIDSRSV